MSTYYCLAVNNLTVRGMAPQLSAAMSSPALRYQLRSFQRKKTAVPRVGAVYVLKCRGPPRKTYKLANVARRRLRRPRRHFLLYLLPLFQVSIRMRRS